MPGDQQGNAGSTGEVRMKPFNPDDHDACVPAWLNYKREFRVQLAAAGLDDKPGKRQVNTLLKNMGIECIKLYDSFEWAPEIPAVAADPANGVEAVERVPAEDKENLEHVFRKFDQHWGVQRYRSIKRQEFLDVKRGESQPIMDFIVELKRKAELCDFGDQKESLICDKIINGVEDERCTERLLDIPDNELTLKKVCHVCRQVELTKAHIKIMKSKSTKDVKKVYSNARGRSRGSRQMNYRGRQSRESHDNWRHESRDWRGNSRHSATAQFSYGQCEKCCKRHSEGQCRAVHEYCGACGEKGHFKRSILCRNRPRRSENQRYENHRPQGHRRNSYNFRGRPYNRNYGSGRNVHNVHMECNEESELCEQFRDNFNMEDIFTVKIDDDNVYCDSNDVPCHDDVYYDFNDNDDENDVENDVNCVENVLNFDDNDVKCDVKCDVNDVRNDVKCDVNDVRNDVKCDVNDVKHDVNDVNYDDDEDVFYDAQSDMSEFVQNDVKVVQAGDVCDVLNTQASDWQAIFDVNGQQLALEIDTAAHCNVISLNTVRRLGLEDQIVTSNVLINGVHNEAKRPHGSIKILCGYRDKKMNLEFQVLNSSRDINLIGRTDSVKLNLVARVHAVDKRESCERIIKSFSDVLGDEIGCLPGEYHIKIDESVHPVVHPPRTLPVAIRDQVRKELEHLENCGILAKVTEPTDWVNSMVAVRKKNGRVRICIDPSDLNRAIKREHFPMSTIEDIATRLHGSKLYSTLDANSGYFQIRLSEESSRLTTFNTPFGRYRYLRMPMGLKCSAEVFQREMSSQFADIDGVEIVVDDILIHGKSEDEHNEILRNVLLRAREIGLKLNRSKSHIGLSEVNYVGHRLTGEGLKPTRERVEAIANMRPPENVQELETILGMIAYVSKFIPGLSTLNAPLRDLKTRPDWKWGANEQKALDVIKKALTSDPVLKYYDVNKPVVLSVDASSRGLGAALIQDKAVIAYASRSLTETEQRYAQIEKETLAVVFGCTKFHKMLYGRHFIVESDHKPLEVILNKSILSAPMRIQRMILKLQPYSFKLIHVRGKSLGLADCLSRLPYGRSEQLLDDELMVCPVDTIVGPQHSKFLVATEADDELQLLKKTILTGWPEVKTKVPPGVVNFWNVRDELSTYNGLLFRGSRIIVPKLLQPEMIAQIHKSHMGVVLSKQRARDLMYWPGMSSQIEDIVSKCSTCLKYRNNQPKEPLFVQPLPERPWSKVGADLFELHGKHYLLLVDYYSNFVEVEKLEVLTTSGVIQIMKRMIARYGIIDNLVSDNGPQFASRQFSDFVAAYNIVHTTSSPLRAQSNGLAERSIQTVKRLMYKCYETGEDLYLALLDLRNTPRDNQVGSPAQRLMGRRTRTRLPTCSELLKPKVMQPTVVSNGLQRHRMTQKKYFDRGRRALPKINEDDAVRIKMPKGWQPAEYVARHQQPRSHIVRSGDQDRVYRRNRDQLLITRENPHVLPPPQPPYVPPRSVVHDSQGDTSRNDANLVPNQDHVVRDPPANIDQQNVNTRSGRTRNEPAWLKDYVRY